VTKVGTCALCRGEGLELQNSHIVAKWAHRLVRDDDGPAPNPIAIANGQAVQSSTELREHLLCRRCEDRPRDAESYVSRIVCQKEGRAPVFDHLGPRRTIDGFPVADPGSVDLEKLCYFAAMVAFRGHAAACVRNAYLLGVHDDLRRYLLGETGFPATVHFTPTTDLSEGYLTCIFYLHGLEFWLSAGESLPDRVHRLCLACGTDKAVVLVPPGHRSMKQVIQEHAVRAELSPDLRRRFRR
jgi:hypothetical protein